VRSRRAGRLSASGKLPFLPPGVSTPRSVAALVNALREAFREGVNAPVRASYPVTGRATACPDAGMGRRNLGVKIVTVFPGTARGLASVSALYC
jgi:hypothetical protein